MLAFLRPLPLVASLLLGASLVTGCLGSNPTPATNSPPTQSQTPPPPPTLPATGTVVSQQQPGFSGKVMSGVIALKGAAPPAGSTLYLGLVKSASDQQPRTCIDAERNPVNEEGQFYAQIACTPQSGDQLKYVLIVGPSGNRDWHDAVVPLPSDLSNVKLDAQ
jgi:hypothetical protein